MPPLTIPRLTLIKSLRDQSSSSSLLSGLKDRTQHMSPKQGALDLVLIPLFYFSPRSSSFSGLLPDPPRMRKTAPPQATDQHSSIPSQHIFPPQICHSRAPPPPQQEPISSHQKRAQGCQLWPDAFCSLTFCSLFHLLIFPHILLASLHLLLLLFFNFLLLIFPIIYLFLHIVLLSPAIFSTPLYQ